MDVSRSRCVAVLEGATCGALLAQECYYQGELVEPANVVYLRVALGRWLRFGIDAGDFFCRETADAAEIPPDPAGEFHFPLVDLGARYPVEGRRVLSATLAERPPDGGELALALDDGAVLALVNEADASRVEYRPAAG